FNRKQEPATQHRSIIVVEVVELDVVEVVALVVVELVVVLVVELVVVELVVVVVTGQLGSPGCIVQVQVPALHWSRMDDWQALRPWGAAPDNPGHPAATSSEPACEPQIGDAALAPETKTPAPSATAANVTPALRVIVEPPMAVPIRRFSCGPGRCLAVTRRQ